MASNDNGRWGNLGRFLVGLSIFMLVLGMFTGEVKFSFMFRVTDDISVPEGGLTVVADDGHTYQLTIGDTHKAVLTHSNLCKADNE